MLVLDEYDDNNNVDEEEELQKAIEEKKKAKEEKKKRKEETKKAKEAAKMARIVPVEQIIPTDMIPVEQPVETPVVNEQPKEPVVKEKPIKSKKEEKVIPVQPVEQIIPVEPVQPVQPIISEPPVFNVGKPKNHKFRNFMLFLFTLILLSGLGLGLGYLVSPYKLVVNGDKITTASYGSLYEDKGATLKRFIFVSHKNIESEGEVRTNKLGTYTITYKADSLTVTRIVNVVDNEPPKIMFYDDDENGNNKPFVLNINDDKKIYRDVYAYDLYDGEIKNITYEENIDTTTIGEYEIKYSACDSSKNCAERTKKVEVKDTQAPIITLNGSTVNLVLGQDKYVEKGATAKDNYDKELGEIKITGTVDENTLGEYEITYSICDSSNNCSSIIRKVYVKNKNVIEGRFVSEPEIDGTLPSVLVLNSNTMTASITLNYCEGISNDTGSYTINGNKLILKLDYDWGKFDTFRFTIVDNNTLKLDTDVVACSPRINEKFKRN